MRIVVKFHEECKADLLAWLARLPGSIEDRRALVELSLDELKREMVRTTGHPATAIYREQPPPPCYWWNYATDCWVRFTTSDSGGLFGTRSRTVEVIGFEPVSLG